jgi:two-component system, chemotaxis family, CheB/CheR fusion protein
VSDASPAGNRLPIVGIGASAGGIEAFQGFFENMPPDSGLAFVVMLHLPADRKSILAEILGRWTSMQIIEAIDGCLVEANCVYVPPSGVTIILRSGRLHLHQMVLDEPREPSPISMFFGSLAQDLHEDAIGVVLSGTGSDGALGLKAIKACGGLTLAQGTDGTSPQHNGMPASAIATGAVDIIAAVEAMPEHIMAVQQSRRTDSLAAELSTEQINQARLEICSVLNKQLNHDFSGYKEKTFLRRVQRRMEVLRLATLPEYVGRLQNDRVEVGMLFRDLLIGVTAFFRDTDAFEAVRQTVIPRLLDGKGANDVVRIWVAGCATGEEAYSLAMLLREYLDNITLEVPKVQIFATDIDEAAIATARAGRYPSTLLEGLTPERLNRFFVAGNDGSFTVTKDVRELCTFSAHSLIRDPPFSRIDLISCRNLLIYLDADLQAGVIPAFHYSLVPDGLLLLGSSEAVSRQEVLFTTLDRSHRIFQRRNTPSPPLRLTGKSSAEEAHFMRGTSAPRPGTPRSGLTRPNNRAAARVLERFAPPFVVVNADGEIIQYSSRTGRFLEAPSGLPSQSVLDMARRGLRAPLRSLLKQSAETGHSIKESRVSIEIPGEGLQSITVAVEPLPEQGLDTAYLIVFIENASHRSDDRGGHEGGIVVDAGSDRHLETELRDTREQLQSVTEEHDTALEELKSANEELHSVNEELQSTNEELETSKEEIQSINEELQTVNVQLASKVDELDRKNNDLQNLFASTQVATIFLDQNLIIRGFTPAVAGLYNLIPSDQGRPLTDIVSQLRYSKLRQDLRQVLSSLEPLERRVLRDDDTTHYLMRILPYRTPDSTVDGVVVTFVEVTSIVQAEQHQRLLVDELNHRVKNMLTVVISLATQTMRRSESLEEFSKSYMGRVHALTAAYSLLSNEGWQTVSLRDIVMEELKPFLASDRANIIAEGPRIPLDPRAALALGMAIHELTTNAVKYGALSVPEGTVTVTWRREQDSNGNQQLAVDWIESGGPPVTPPAHRGFGMMLIERGLRQDIAAEVEVDFAVGGVRASVRAPLRTGTIQATDSSGGIVR